MKWHYYNYYCYIYCCVISLTSSHSHFIMSYTVGHLTITSLPM